MKATNVEAPAQAGHEESDVRLQQGDAGAASLFVKVFRLAVRGMVRFLFRVRVKGLERLPRTPAIICANHLGWIDPFLILCFFPVEPRIYVLGYSLNYIEDQGAKGFRKGVVDRLRVMVPLHIDRPIEAIRTMKDVLKRGGSLLLFVEGTAMGAQEGQLMEVQGGAAHLSQVSGIPLVPVGITGSKELWFRRRLTLRVGNPITPDGFEGKLHERVEKMTARLETDLRRLLPGDRQRARIKLLRGWLTGLFFQEETPDQRRRMER